MTHTSLVGLAAGSFDPVTLGHMDMFRRALLLVDKLVIAVASHATKQALLSPEDRCALLKSACAEWPGAERVQVCFFDGLVVDLARAHKASVIIRGLRNSSDYEYEASMANMNRALYQECDTVFLAARGEYAAISSTLVRQIAAMGGDVSPFVPPAVLSHLQQKKHKK